MPGGLAFADDDARGTQETIGEFVAALKLLNDVAFCVVGGLNLVDGFVQVRVERLARVGDDLLQAEFHQCPAKLAVDLHEDGSASGARFARYRNDGGFVGPDVSPAVGA